MKKQKRKGAPRRRKPVRDQKRQRETFWTALAAASRPTPNLPELSGLHSSRVTLRDMGETTLGLHEQRRGIVNVCWFESWGDDSPVRTLRRLCGIADAHGMALVFFMPPSREAEVLARLGFKNPAFDPSADGEDDGDSNLGFLRPPGGGDLRPADIRFVREIERDSGADAARDWSSLREALYTGEIDSNTAGRWVNNWRGLQRKAERQAASA